MSADPTAADQQRRAIAEFLQVLPLTVALAGLPDSPPGAYFNDGQMENRATTLRNAYKHARALLKEISTR